ncbi:MAG TPA: sulfatase/phosphatase domain-containing protein, partial [Armatimonadota bacterium]|nr:sulfatase/phosphatase domain-containing protein [Armatimonadota bacterium]
ATLEEMGQLDNTVIVFAGDNGYLHGEHGQGDKRVMYEESIRIPMVMRYPKRVKPGTLVNQMALNIDLAPTFLDLAGVKSPAGVQGESWRPLFNGKSADWRKDFYYEYDLETPYVRKPEVRGIRTERWKYAETPLLQDIPELYDLKDDPYEMHNLQGKPEYVKIQADLKARLTEMEREAGYAK